MIDSETPVMPPLFHKLHLGELGNKDAECDANSDHLDMREQDD